ncbi:MULTISPECIES: serine hydrolase domain-containing protein [Chryseobacterium]|uniref:CubicO group peptidase (Beta-lactamase class C family) n=1 Tax=Chryseobacterium camelliae TaxID=1265445 RepID=A0ABU0TEG4_9FLAO|nr:MULTISPECIES: serine hydrolase domain-containing protein [Chryseobacterium]MDT3406754.1 CubicO group peptidase (beta-lactamase class C family) [Pseudacidovorax intermedius]MDQ1095449.1 CubicO group peptidase (beta-lactamase class C family) [Chryseobacterium camelliae]MDQ1099389.1 CubicO group peptidase (beta-lactamase class C family) [Chryseobacterium sp. SORGH_AS_1048]MDR6086735.1 CubicO group peptidase (beta-lactamase class C family) [Chryseobacterium sp. SORGH_AS_0909]MDR6131107.1 CubicO
MQRQFLIFIFGCWFCLFSTFGFTVQAQTKANLHTINLKEKKEEIDRIIKAYAAINKFNGTALVHYQNENIFERSYGWQNAEKKIPNQDKSVYQIASLTKSFTALIIVKLSEEGKLSVKDPISKYIADYPRGNEITVEHLLTHTSGIYEVLQNKEYFSMLHTGKSITKDKELSFFKNEPLAFEPGTQFSYTNSGYILLGIIIEKITGLSYEDTVRKIILNPLKMTHTGFNYMALKSTHKTVPYSYISNTRQEKTEVWNSTLTGPAGQIYSTVEDLYRYYVGLRDYKIVSRETFKKATTPYLSGYGYGWFIDDFYGKKLINHGGNIEGSTSYFAMLPEDDLCIILLNNITSKKLETAGNTILAAILEQPYTLPQPNKETALSEDVLKKYVGDYELSDHTVIHIIYENGQLFIQNNKAPKVRMRAKKEDVFFLQDDDTEISFIFKKGEKDVISIKKGLSSKTAEKL